jgi:hypothetical protein
MLVSEVDSSFLASLMVLPLPVSLSSDEKFDVWRRDDAGPVTEIRGLDGREIEEKSEDEILSVPPEAASISPVSDVVMVRVTERFESVALPLLISLIIGVTLKVRGAVAPTSDIFNSPPVTTTKAKSTEATNSPTGAMEQRSMDSQPSAQWYSEV